jgi:ComF family protein
MGMLRNLINGLVDIIYPKVCLVCKNKLGPQAIDNLVCGECWAKIKKNQPPFCHSCGRHLSKTNLTKNICQLCLKRPAHFDRAFSPCSYEGITKILIHEFKYGSKDYLGFTLNRLLTEFIREYDLPLSVLDLIVPVPLHKTRLREREYNQAEILSRHLAGEFKKELVPDILIRNRYTKTQTELESDKRPENVRGSFSINKATLLKNKNILLVDDVLTTGATSSEAAAVLKEAGAKIVFVLTVAN